MRMHRYEMARGVDSVRRRINPCRSQLGQLRRWDCLSKAAKSILLREIGLLRSLLLHLRDCAEFDCALW